ncbi:MAG: SprT family zinc-dependent metalloprotease [Mariprofundaceae bacterium]|nr:SprT family zinc-dependent metalloprotease [Mariprofundaceae bacterium]
MNIQQGEAFAWQMRMSKRAKRPRITLDKYGVVELVWPEKMSTRTAPKLMLEHTPWILQRLEGQPPQQAEEFPPSQLDLLAMNQCWQVYDAQHDAQHAGHVQLLEQEQGTLLISAEWADREKLRLLLCAWLKEQAKAVLIPMLADIAEEMGEHYASVSIRLQKRRWGSCSIARRINLNAALLFLPPVLVRHVLIHELAHLQHHNHSAKFWAWVAQHDSCYKQHRADLHAQSHLVPQWLTHPIKLYN